MIKKILIGVIALIVIGAIFGQGSDGDSVEAETADNGSSSSSESADTSGATSDDAASDEGSDGGMTSMGEPASDGQFRFTVKGFDCGVESVGGGFMEEKAQGQFCIVTIKVKNTGNEARMLDASSQYLFDAKERKFEASSEASISLEKNNTFLEDINPGNGVVGKVVFDVPKKGFRAHHLELHDSMFSDGVDVSLR